MNYYFKGEGCQVRYKIQTFVSLLLVDRVEEYDLTSATEVEFDDISPVFLCKGRKLNICSLLTLAMSKYHQIITFLVLVYQNELIDLPQD